MSSASRQYAAFNSICLVVMLVACSFFIAYIPGASADSVPPNTEVTLLDQDYSVQASIPDNIVLGNNINNYTTATLNYNSSAGAIEYRTVDDQVGNMFVGIEPFINGNISISLKVSSDNRDSNVDIVGSTFEIVARTRIDGSAEVTSLYDTDSTAEGSATNKGLAYVVPASALINGVNTINIMISGTTRTVTVYHDSSHRMTTPMSDWSVQKLPYDPVTSPMIEFENEKSSLATWMSTFLYGVTETVSGGLVSAIPGNDFVPFGIDYPNVQANLHGTDYMSSSGQKGVAWVDIQWLEWQGQPLIAYTNSLLNAGWELGIHYNVSLSRLPIAQAEAVMQAQYAQIANIFGRAPTSWCSFQNADNVTLAIFAYDQLGMIWRNGYSGIGFIPDIGNFQESWWPTFWSNVSKAQMVYPSFTHATDQPFGIDYSIGYANFTKWVDNYDGKHIIGFNEYYHRIMNQVDTQINYLDYVQGERLRFSIECNEFPTRLVIDFPMVENLTVLKNGNPLVRDSDYSVIDSDHIALFGESGAVFEITSVGAPSAPQGLQADAGNAQVNLTWSDPSNHGSGTITNYKVYRSLASGAETLLTTLGNVLEYTDTGLSNGLTYYYKVTAVNSVGEGPLSGEASAKPGSGITPPSAPQNLQATIGNAQNLLSWSAPASNGGSTITAYRIYRGNASSGESLLTTVGNVLGYTDTGLINGQTYYYKVSAVNSAGEGPLSTEAVSTPASVPSGDYIYVLVNGGAAVQITGYRGLGGAVTIPSEITGKPVISIGDYAFQSCLSLTSLVIPSSVTTLGKGAFCYDTALVSVSIPNSVTSISTYTFYGCTHLTSLTIPGSITVIGDYSFYQLTSLTSLTISNGVRSIGNASFYYCSALTSVTIPSSVTYIGHHAFAYCSALTSVSIPNGVTTVSDHAFQQCTALTSVAIPGSISYIGDYAFQSCTALTSLTISGGVRSIGIGAFCYCSALTSVTIPVSVTSVGTYAFYYCTGLTQMTFQGNAPTCGSNWIGGHNANLKIYFYNGASGFTTPTWQGVSSISLGTPSAPQSPMATAGNAQVILTWSAPASNGGSSITGYKVYRGTASGAESLLTTLGNVLTFTNSGLTNGQTYYYKVSAVNAIGEGSLSAEVSAVPATQPTAPLNLQATLGNAQVVLTWSVPAGNGGALITAYKVYRGNSANGESVLTTLGNVLTYTDTGLTNGQIYYYKVTAVNSVGEGAQSNEASASPASVPSAPQDFQASTGIAQVVLTWSAPASNGGRQITAYDIYRSTTPGEETFFASAGSGLSYTDASVLDGQTYYYKVSAVNAIGEGPLSDEANATSILTFTLPSAPTLSSAIYGNDQVTLTWAAPISNGGESIMAYNIYRNTTSGQEELLDTVGNVLTYHDASVIDGQTYYYKISAVNDVGEGPLSNERSATTSSIPSAPLDLQATAGNAQINLTWSAPASNGGSPIVAYNVYCGSSSNGETMLATLGNVLTYTASSLTNGQVYYFMVTAANSVTEGPCSNEASATPASVATVPSAPQDLHATAGNAQVMLTWTAPANNGGALITAYMVYSGTTPGGETLLATVGNVLTYTAGSLVNGQVYYFKVTAVNSVGEGPQSNEASATPLTEPSAPLGLSATPGNAQVTLTWSAPASNGGTTITGYRVYRGTTSGGEALLTTLGNVLTYSNTGLTNGQSYYYKVSAVNSVGEGPQSNEASATPVTVPSAPQSLSATAGNAQVTLTWSAPTSNGGSSITGYKVYRGAASGGETLLATLGNVLTYSNTGLTNGQSYYYKVSAVNSAGEGPQSNEASATPVTVPSAPQGLSGTAGNAQVVLTWSAPASNGGALITAYKVYSGTSPGGETLLATLGNVLTYTDTGLTNGLTYYYKVTAVNSVGEGPLSGEASASPGSGATVPTAPQNLLGTLGNAQVVLSWSAPTSNGGSSITAYKIYRGNASSGESLLTTVGNVLTYTDTGLINGQTYYYKVSAVNSAGEGPLSIEAVSTPASVPSGDYIYALVNGGTAVQITGYRGLGGAVTIPSEITGKPVVSIGDYAVQKSTTITSLVIPSSVTTLGKGAFCYDTALTSVSIPNSVTSISTYTFYGCTHLTSLTIPGSIASIGDYSFYQLTSLTSLTISSGVRSIGNASFYYCSALTSVTIPNSVTSIGHHAFAYCSALTSVSIPNGVTIISDHAFQQCIALASVTIPGSVAYIGDYAFQSCTGLTSLTISNGVTTIGVGAFCYCSALTSVTIPATVTTIGTYAFYYCTGLTQMTFQGNAPTCGANWIAGHYANLRIYYYNDAFGFTNPTWNGITTIILTR